MTLESPLVARERLLLYGEPATGKTNAYLSIAKLLKLTKSPARLFVIDNDKSVARMTESANLSNVIVTEVYDWQEHNAALKAILREVTPDDWLIVDLMSETWSVVQEYYTEQVFEDDIGSYFLQIRKDMSNKDNKAFDGWKDWSVINKLYGSFCRPFIYKSPCHIVATATADPTNVKLDDKETLSVFGRVGHRPEGQKRLKHQFNTTVFFHKSNNGEYRYTTVKDRERPLQIAASLGTDDNPKSFAIEYLIGVAGWQIA